MNSHLFLGDDSTDLNNLRLVWKLKYGHGSSVNGSWLRLSVPKIQLKKWLIGCSLLNSHLFLGDGLTDFDTFELVWKLKCGHKSRIMVATSGFGDITGNVIFRPTLHELTSVSWRWLDRFELYWASLKATNCSQIKFKFTMAPTFDSGEMTEKVTYMPTLPGEKNLSIKLLEW